MRRLSGWILLLWAASAAAQPSGDGAGASGEAAGASPDPAGEALPAPVEPAATPGTPVPAGTEEPKAPPPTPAEASTRVDVDRAGEAAEAPPAAPGSGDEAYRLKITELESRVNELKERIFRTKTRLAILKETVLSSSIAGSEARLVHRNEMGSSFRLEKVTYSLDGTPIYSGVDKDGDLDGREQIEIFNGPIVPGNHTVSVVMVYRGNGYGIFSYLRGYLFTLRSSHTFHAEEGKLMEIRVVGYEKGGITTDLKDRPDIRFEDKLTDVRRGPSAAATDTGKDG